MRTRASSLAEQLEPNLLPIAYILSMAYHSSLVSSRLLFGCSDIGCQMERLFVRKKLFSAEIVPLFRFLK